MAPLMAADTPGSIFSLAWGRPKWCPHWGHCKGRWVSGGSSLWCPLPTLIWLSLLAAPNALSSPTLALALSPLPELPLSVKVAFSGLA